MNHIKKLALAAAIALVGATGAQAAVTQIAGSDTPITQLNTFGGDNQWTFSDAGLQQLNLTTGLFSGPALTRTKGNSFVDVFIVNIPDEEYVSLGFGNVRGSAPSVSFTELDIGFAYGTGPVVYSDTYGARTFSVSTDTLELYSGTYEFDIYGTFTKSGGSFEGDVFGSPVPEPGNWALMLAGLGAVGMLARRRRSSTRA